jgi:ABC-type transport system involved in cytochrome c biogenesis permease subunit
MYEFSITGALAFTGAYLIALRKHDLRWLGLFVSIAVLLTLGTAITLLYRDSAPLVPALKSTWLVIHVIAAIISGGVFLLSNVIAGARYWGWDPKETWAFITWVAYAAYLHARVTVGWRGRRAAWLCLFAGSTFLFNYVYVNVWGTGKHTYSGL